MPASSSSQPERAVVDFHSHLVPAVDDGAESIEQTRDALRLMREQGVRTVVTTPHLSGALTERPGPLASYFATLDAAWDGVRALAAAEFPDLRVERGFEVMLDTPTPDLSDPRVRLAGSSFVLIEFPFMTIPPNCTQALFQLKVGGIRPIIAHPERYRNFSDLSDADEWRSIGALLQVNCGSLLGRYGDSARRISWSLLELGWADYLSSDYHARGRLHVAECRETLVRAGAHEQVALLMEENPARMLRSEEPAPVPPLRRQRSLWQRLFGRS